MTTVLVVLGNIAASPLVQKILWPAISELVLKWMESHRVKLETKAAFTAAKLAEKSQAISDASMRIRNAMAR